MRTTKQLLKRSKTVILISPRRAGDARMAAALKPLIGAIPVAAMQGANYSVDRDADKLTPAQAARELTATLLPLREKVARSAG